VAGERVAIERRHRTLVHHPTRLEQEGGDASHPRYFAGAARKAYVRIRREVVDEPVYHEILGDGPDTVVLVHGAGGTHVSWFQQLVPLCEAGFRLVIVDLPGFGRTPGPLSIPAAADLVLSTFDGQAHLVGQSLGGWVISAAAERAPERVGSLLYSATPGGISATREIAFATVVGPPDPAILGDHPAAGPTMRSDLQVLYQQLGSMAPSPPRRDVGTALTSSWFDAATITAPARFLSGTDDPIFPPAVIATAARALGADHVLLDGCGHSPYFEDAAAWNAPALEWLGGRDSNPE
jgi:pimeloyl-ACP methyl ester carboxylesterase